MTKRNIPSTNERDRLETMATPVCKEHSSKGMLIPRLLASLISLTVVGLGIMAVVTQHYYGRSSKHGNAEVSLDGAAAVGMGVATVFLGLVPLALWFRSKRPALAWAVVCISVAAIAFCTVIYGAKR
jgi:cell division protein FtsW (lipid II flippase)